MVHRNLLVPCCMATVLTLALMNGCRDFGSLPPPPPLITDITPSVDTVGAEVKIVGTNFGGSQGDSYVLFNTIRATNYPEWRDDEIKVLVPGGAISGMAKVVVGGQESNGFPFQVLGSFGVTQKIVLLIVGDSLVQAISGGIPPYTFVSKGDTTKAAVSITDSLLTIRGVAAGSSTVIIGDGSTPQLRDTINAFVSTPVSFSGQIQPVFTNNCVSGCHTPGGIGPFPLGVGVSYGNIVDVVATVSTPGCAGGPYRVQRSSADSSVLYRRISGTSCGGQMPQNRPPLSTVDQNLIRDWINQGALNN